MNIGEVRECAHCGGKGSVWIGPEIVQIPSPPNK
jgi:hypothetical protein